MNDALLQNAERLKQNRASVRRPRVAPAQNAVMGGTAQAGTLSAGARVFDAISGEEGEVIHVGRHNVVVRPTE